MSEERVICEIRIDKATGQGDSDLRMTNFEVIMQFKLQSTMKTLCPAHTSTTKNWSENWFVCADFCTDIKLLRSFLRVAYDKNRSVCADFSPI